MKIDFQSVLIGAAATVVGMYVYDRWIKPTLASA